MNVLPWFLPTDMILSEGFIYMVVIKCVWTNASKRDLFLFIHIFKVENRGQ